MIVICFSHIVLYGVSWNFEIKLAYCQGDLENAVERLLRHRFANSVMHIAAFSKVSHFSVTQVQRVALYKRGLHISEVKYIFAPAHRPRQCHTWPL